MIPRWHDGALEMLAPGDAPIVWSVAIDGPDAAGALAEVRATSDDLADAARAPDGGDRLLRRRLARALVAHVAGERAADVHISRSVHGAPMVIAPTGWHVGLSGRGGACLIAVARRPIAVDREPIDDAPPLPDMLTPAEVQALDRLPAKDRPAAWLRRWTIKEAHAKLIGEPLRIRPEAIATHIASETEATATFEGQSRCWSRIAGGAIETVAMWA